MRGLGKKREKIKGEKGDERKVEVERKSEKEERKREEDKRRRGEGRKDDDIMR